MPAETTLLALPIQLPGGAEATVGIAAEGARKLITAL